VAFRFRGLLSPSGGDLFNHTEKKREKGLYSTIAGERESSLTLSECDPCTLGIYYLGRGGKLSM